MQNLATLLSLDEIKRLALPSNFKYGEAIYIRGGVEIIERSPTQVKAWVGGLDGTVSEGAGSRRRTQLIATPEGLAWHCTGNPKNHDIFCKHCVALALTLLKNR
ncbi:MAG TPA: hypothetical protein VLF40_03310 [Candidatus Saccharimonadales bacterium]|nr:hypothetical protein [Candidatus Saccharimonadales bacterium]